jgi:exodeoxyribonuclease VII large subunit
MALETSVEHPAPVRQISNLISGWVGRLGAVWVEGQIAQLSRRQGMGTVFITLRDSSADVSLSVTCSRAMFDGLNPPVVEGAQVVVHGKPSFYANRGTLSLYVDDIRTVGLGELLARLERRRQLLAAEGLFEAVHKKRLPFLPHGVGLITGRQSAAERDVLENAKRRWPAVAFTVENTAVQGPNAAREVIEALRRLDEDPTVDVIVIARGGGSVEDLLPFSDEGLIRAVFEAKTPVVSAIGHEPDQPLLDLVADVRASTPTDAAKRVVPDMTEESERVETLRRRSRTVLAAWLGNEQRQLDLIRGRPALASPTAQIAARADEVHSWRERGRRVIRNGLDRGHDELGHHLARVRALSPLATLERGYAVLQTRDGHVVSSVADVAPGTRFTARVSDGNIAATVDGALTLDGTTTEDIDE